MSTPSFPEGPDAVTLPVADRIAAARGARGYTQERLGEMVGEGVGKVQISKWERGENTPGADAIAKLSQALGVTADYLLGLTDEMRPPSLTEAQRAIARIQDVLREELGATPDAPRHETSARGHPRPVHSARKRRPS